MSGDIVIVSIPSTVNAKGETDTSFFAKLERQLNPHAGIPLLLMDEVHHENAPSWRTIKDKITALSESRGIRCRRVGFTATPLPEQKERQIYHLSLHEALNRGIVPDTNIMAVKTGILLDNLRTGSRGDFVAAQLSQSVNTPERNDFIMGELAKIPKEYRNGTGDAFLPILGFAVDRQHTRDLARAFQEKFGVSAKDEARLKTLQDRGSHPADAMTQLRRESEREDKIYLRRIEVIDANITLADLEKLISKKERGEINSLIAVVDGMTKPKVFTRLIQLAKEGHIEAVFSCKKLEEGFDAFWARIVVGAKPTLSAQQRAQELGRITRRGHDEYDAAVGKLLKTPPRLLMDFIDGGYDFAEYREVAGMRTMLLEDGVIYNLTSQAPADAHQEEEHKRKRKKRQKSPAKKRDDDDEALPELPQNVWDAQERLRRVLENVYGYDVARMASDLGLDEEELEDNLTNPTWVLTYREVCEIAALLYQDRREFLSGTTASDNENRYNVLTARIHDVLWESLTAYLGHEGLALKPQDFVCQAGEAEFVMNLVTKQIKNLPRHNLVDSSLMSLGVGLYYLLGEAKMMAAQELLRQSLDEWTSADPLHGAQNQVLGQMSWDLSLNGMLETMGRLSAEKKSRFVDEWFSATHPGVGVPHEIYITAGSYGVANGKISGGLQVRTVEEFEGWVGKDKFEYPKIRCVRTARGWEMDWHKGTSAAKILALIEAVLVSKK